MPFHSQGSKNVNRVEGLVDFLRRWDDREELTSREIEFTVAQGGNINLQASFESSQSHLLTRWHPSFAASIEAGVRELVKRLVTDWDCVTYSSCEGHRSTTHVPMRVRNVRMLPRSKAEHLRLAAMLDRLANTTNAGLRDPAVRLTWQHSVLQAEGGLKAPGLDLIFEPQTSDEPTSWQVLDACYQACLRHVRRGTTER
jgi:hypothetical protein